MNQLLWGCHGRRWVTVDQPPEGVHDVWLDHQTNTYLGYVLTLTGERIIRLGQMLISLPNKDFIIYDLDTFQTGNGE